LYRNNESSYFHDHGEDKRMTKTYLGEIGFDDRTLDRVQMSALTFTV
jgi:hypothetical protein